MSILMLIFLVLQCALACKVAIFVLCFDDESCTLAKAHQFTCAITYRMPRTKADFYLESSFYDGHYLIHHEVFDSFDYVGVIAYKADKKVVLPPDICARPCAIAKPAYRFPLRPGYLHLERTPLLYLAQKFHGAIFTTCWRQLFEQQTRYAPDIYLSDRLAPVYFNYWLAKPALFLEYARTVQELKRIISTNDTVYTCMHQDPKYRGALPWHFKWMGRFTLHPFIFERTLPVFLLGNGVNISILN